MKRSRLLPCLFLCLSLAVPSLAAEEAPFTDVPQDSWFAQGVATCAQRGIMIGTGEGTFSPDTQLTSAECLTLALRLYDLQRGGDGSLEEAPEGWGAMTFTLADGKTFYRYGEHDPFFSYTRFDAAAPDGRDLYAVYVLAPGESAREREAYAKAHEGRAVFTVEGRDYPGTVTADATYDGPCLRFSFDAPQADRPDLDELFHTPRPGPNRWYRNAVYTCETWGLSDAEGFRFLLSPLSYSHPDQGLASRGNFAYALAAAGGTLEKKFQVPSIPDVERESGETLYMLYESGVLGGVDPFGTFCSDKFLSRAEAAVMAARVLEPDQRLSSPPAQPNAYDQAVIDLRGGFTYYEASEQRYETDECTIFVYDRGGAMHTGNGHITILYKPGSQPGAGAIVEEQCPGGWGVYQDGVDMFRLSEDGKTLTYAYLLDEPERNTEGQEVTPAGVYTYTVDLPTGVTTPSYAPLSHEGVVQTLAYGRNYTLENRIDGDSHTVLLRWKPLNWEEPDVRDYELWVVSKDETGTCHRLLLPSTIVSKYDYTPTHRGPDGWQLSEDGRTLTYLYAFSEPLLHGDTVLHEAGTYVYTADLTTGEVTARIDPVSLLKLSTGVQEEDEAAAGK